MSKIIIWGFFGERFNFFWWVMFYKVGGKLENGIFREEKC